MPFPLHQFPRMEIAAPFLLHLLLPAFAISSQVSHHPVAPLSLETYTDLAVAYNHSVLLDDDQVDFFWTLSADSISIAARCKRSSGYLAIAFGDGMVDSYAFVGWINDTGKGRVSSYWINGKDPSSVQPTGEELLSAGFRSESGLLSMEFRLSLSPFYSGNVECERVIDPSSPLRVVWALGPQWSDGRLSWSNVHSITSDRAVGVFLTNGTVEEVKDVPLALAFHGFLMLLSWGILLPCGALAARYLRHVEGDRWFRLHLHLQCLGLCFAAFAIFLAAVELRGLALSSTHATVGMVATAMAFAQPINAYLRPEISALGEVASNVRILWSCIHICVGRCSILAGIVAVLSGYLRPEISALGEVASNVRILWSCIHICVGRCSILAGIVAVLSGLKHVADAYDFEAMDGLTWGFMLWVLVGVIVVLFLENKEMKRRRRDENFLSGRFISENNEEVSVDLLRANEVP